MPLFSCAPGGHTSPRPRDGQTALTFRPPLAVPDYRDEDAAG